MIPSVSLNFATIILFLEHYFYKPEIEYYLKLVSANIIELFFCLGKHAIMIELIARKREEMNYTLEEKEAFMREALKEAKIALEHDEIPIGCVIVKDGKIIGRGHNAREELQRAVMHAEIMAIENANLSEESWRLLDCTLFVTIEPCVMCSGAIGLARIPNVVYGAKNQKFGAAGSLYDILTDERLNHRVDVETGVLENECAEIMQDFFRNRRKK